MRTVAVTDERIRTLLPVHLLDVGAAHKQEPRTRPSGASFYQFLCTEKGTGRYESETDSEELSEGIVVFTRKGIPNRYYGTDETFRTGWVTFDGTQIDDLLSYLHAESSAFLKSERVCALISEIYRLAERNAAPEVLSQGVYELIVSFFTELNEGKKTPTLIRAKAYIEEHFAKDLSVADIARSVGISESLLFRLFREEEKTTPIDYLRTVRITKAKQLLLESSELRVSDVAARCGFSDSAYFCKVFRREAGMTPKIYRTRYAL